MGASEYEKVQNTEVLEIVGYSNQIPYSLIREELESGYYSDLIDEFGEIEKYYDVYKRGANFVCEGSNSDYIPSCVRFKAARRLINKEARFMFSQFPDFKVSYFGLGDATDTIKQSIDVLQKLIDEVFKKNNMKSKLIKAAKDCFIGKRIAVMVDYSAETGVHVNFYKSTNFLYETKPDSEELTKFVGYTEVKKSKTLSLRRILRKRYTLENEKIYVQETLFNGSGVLIEEIIPKTLTELENIPAVIIINDGLLGDERGESEIEQLSDLESLYSRLANADVDAERKSMNPIRYTVDMAPNSTQNLSSGAGAYWDLVHDQNIDNPSPSVGTLSPSMQHSEPLKITLSRINEEMHKSVDMPDVTLENITGVITSGKGMKAIYWDLQARCNEKFTSWEPALIRIMELIIDGWGMYPEAYKMYKIDGSKPNIDYECNVVLNYAIMQDEESEKSIDIQEINAQTRSRKSYLMKWNDMSDKKADEELEQIAFEAQLFDSMNIAMGFSRSENKETEEDVQTENMGREFVKNENISENKTETDTETKETEENKENN